jgi:hypothetical protein
MVYDKRIDIVLITETHFTKYSYIFIPGYVLLKSNHPDSTAHADVAILIKSKLKFHPLANFSQDYIQSCAISITLNNIPFAIVAIYSPLRHKLSNVDLTNYFNTMPTNFLIGGDYKSKHKS